MTERRVQLPPAAARELDRRYRAEAEAERALVDYMRGICDALNVSRHRVAGFDEETGELILELPDSST